MNYLSSLNEIYREKTTSTYSSPDYIWRSKFQGHGHTLIQVCGGKGIYVDTGTFKSIFWLDVQCSKGLKSFSA